MKISSKYKDYYDFVLGHNAYPRKVYIRTLKIFTANDKEIPKLLIREVDIHTIASVKEFFIGEVWFCNERYPYIHDLIHKKIYFIYENIPEEIKSRYNYIYTFLLKNNFYLRINSLETIFGIKLVEFGKKFSRKKQLYWQRKSEQHDERLRLEKLKQISYNEKFNSPIIYSRIREGLRPEIVMNGSLEEIEFKQIKSPTEAFQNIYNWIKYIEPEVPSDIDDIQRFEGQGFDVKTSFRGK